MSKAKKKARKAEFKMRRSAARIQTRLKNTDRATQEECLRGIAYHKYTEALNGLDMIANLGAIGNFEKLEKFGALEIFQNIEEYRDSAEFMYALDLEEVETAKDDDFYSLIKDKIQSELALIKKSERAAKLARGNRSEGKTNEKCLNRF